MRYEYYPDGLLKKVTDGSGSETSYTYDRNGNLLTCTRADGSVQTLGYDEAGRLETLTDCAAGGEVLLSYVYTYDKYGNISEISGEDATSAEEGLTALIAVSGSGTGIYSVSFEYDLNNRLISYNGEEVRYDARGNMTWGPVNGEFAELTYDCRNRLVSAGGVTYTYDAENIRTSLETEDYCEEYVTDTVSSALSRVLEKKIFTKNSDGTETLTSETVYVYGNDLMYEKVIPVGGVSENEDQAGTEGKNLAAGGISYAGTAEFSETYFHHYNHLGSTMKLTDAAGEVKASYTYGPYGELLSGDSSLTDYLYNGSCGVITDPNGLLYQRQRYYNTEIKRFINQDVLTGSITNPLSLNRYAYVQGNPVSYVDPFGLSPISNFFSGTAATHLLLGALGMIPGIGFVFDIADAKLYESEGRDEEAALSYFCAAAGAAGNVFRFVGWFTKAGSAANAATRVGERLANLAVHSAMAGSYVSGAGEALSRINAIKRANPDAGIMDYADEWTDLWLNVAGAVLGTSLSVKDVRAVRNAGKELDFAIGELKAAGAAKGTQNLIMDSSARFFSEDVGCCFVEGTMVNTIGGGVAIEDISAGDLVLAGDPVTGDVAYRKVLEIYRKDADTLVHIILENGEEIVTTLTHPFYVDGSGWIPAGSLDTSDRLLAADGTDIRIKDIWVENLEETITVYNFQVEDYHTYFVGDTQILVHNTCSAGDVAGTIGNQGGSGKSRANLTEGGKNSNEFFIDDWTGYPEELPKPEGPFRILEGEEYNAARNLANKANANIHKSRPDLKGTQIHEMHPVKFGGSPTDIDNKIALSPKEHARYTAYWNKVLRNMKNGASCIIQV